MVFFQRTETSFWLNLPAKNLQHYPCKYKYTKIKITVSDITKKKLFSYTDAVVAKFK